MQSKQKLFVFPTSRSIRSFVQGEKKYNKLLPVTLTIDEFFKKSILLEEKKYIDEEQRFLFLKEAIKDIDISKLGITDNFTKFLKQNDYIYRFFLELASEQVDLEKIKDVDTYDYYFEHLEILKNIKENYLKILDKNSCVDRINMHEYYKINKNFLSRFEEVELYFEGYFTKVEFSIIEEISKNINLKINFYSNEYNQKSLKVFDSLINEEFLLDYDYKIDLTNKEILSKNKIIKHLESYELKAFNSRINQISYIKTVITSCVNEGINPSNIALVLPDESFASSIQLFDNEKYFNYAMGRSIKSHNLYQVANAIFLYLSEDEIKNSNNLEYLKIDKIYVDNELKSSWNNNASKEKFDNLCKYLKTFENNIDLLEKFEELIYKINFLLFSNAEELLFKDLYKIFLQKLAKLTIDDVNSGKITVLGLLETRAVNFDVVIICDFNESFIPKKSVKDKFLSSKIKEAVNLPTSNDRESLQKYYYKRLINSSKKVFISYVHSDTNQITRFANELFSNKIDEKINDNSYKHILYNNHKIKYLEENIIDKIDLAKFIWSATSLKVFLQCKKKFYLQYILKLDEHTLSLKPKAFELGDIIHKILEKYYTIDTNSKEELSFDKVEALFNEYKASNAFLILDLEIWKKRLYNFYINDLERLKYRKIEGLEKAFNIEFEGIKIKGVIDRIDKFEDTYEVIDYKTSSSLKVDTLKNYEKSNDFQLEFYYLALSELYNTDKVNAYYYDLYNNKLLEEIALDKKLELLIEKFNEIKELSKNEIEFVKCEEKSTCQFCIYKTICNRD